MIDELLAQFLVEGPELVQEGAEALLALERRPDDRDSLDAAFRAIHTLKGSVALFDLPAMAAVLHAAETLLGAARAGERGADAAMIGDMLAVLSQTERWLGQLQAAGRLSSDASAAADELLARLAGEAFAPSQAPDAAAPRWAVDLVEAVAPSLEGPVCAVRYTPLRDSYFTGDDPIAIASATPGLAGLRLGLRDEDSAAAVYDPFACRLVVELVSAAVAEDVRAAFRFVPDQVEIAALVASPRARETATSEAAPARTLRVDAGRVEALAALADELVAARSGFAELAALVAAGGDAQRIAERLSGQVGGLERLTAQIHQGVAGLRMAPVAPLLRRLPRIVREMGADLGKDVELAVRDGGVEADRRIVEGLFEPLTHLLRNAVDHGVEDPDARARAGKPARARIVLEVCEGGGRLAIRLADDGRGIDPDAIRRVAAERGLLAPERLASLSDEEAVELVFLPGFSTARAVTSLSGRGVGMDAVHTAVQRLGGRLSLSSRLGRGATIDIDLPLSVALTKILVVSADEQRYGVPMDRVMETLRLPAARITPIRAGHAFDWRDEATPLLPLGALVGGGPELPPGDPRVLVVRSGGRPVGVAVDAILDRLDAPLRPLEGLLTSLRGVAGTTTLADGHVLMVLDPEALIG